MSDDAVYLTRAGYERLKRELDLLTTVETMEMAERMAAVREEADFAQEPAFFDAMSDKNLLDERIARLRAILQRAEIIEGDLDPESATPGDHITVKDLDTGEELDLHLLSGAEIALGQRGVSLGSPVGRALLGKKVGETLEVKVPDGITRYKVISIEAFKSEDSNA
ncbi:MAG: GreA/GreB family elongation factor [Chloroflexota bacterium]